MNCPFTNQPCDLPKSFNVGELKLCLKCFSEHFKNLDLEQQANLIINAILELPNYKSCPKCGLSLFDLSKNKKFGCNYCYLFFKNELEIFLKICQDNPIHVGKRPPHNNLEKIESLKEKMKKAIEVENYEIAAMLRDKIKELNNSV